MRASAGVKSSGSSVPNPTGPGVTIWREVRSRCLRLNNTQSETNRALNPTQDVAGQILYAHGGGGPDGGLSKTNIAKAKNAELQKTLEVKMGVKVLWFHLIRKAT